MKRAVPVVPYGYRITAGLLMRDASEQAVISIIRDERARGTSFARIAEKLRGRGFTTRTGKPFGTTAVYTIARRETTETEGARCE